MSCFVFCPICGLVSNSLIKETLSLSSILKATVPVTEIERQHLGEPVKILSHGGWGRGESLALHGATTPLMVLLNPLCQKCLLQ